MSMNQRIRRARRHAKLTQAQLASRVAVHRSAAGQWEQPGQTEPSMPNLRKIATICNVRFEWLATGHGGMLTLEPTPVDAVDLTEFAHDEIELKALRGLRRIPSQRARAFFADAIWKFGEENRASS